MKKFCGCRMEVLFSLLLVMLSAPSCVNEDYDMSDDNLDLEVTPFEDGLIIPLGHTEDITMKAMLSGVETDVLRVDEEGGYHICLDGSFDMTEELAMLKDLVDIPDPEFSHTLVVRFEDDGVFGNDHYDSSIDEAVEFTVIPGDYLPAEVISLGVVELHETYVNVDFDISELPALYKENLSLNLTADFPDMVKVEGADENGVLNIPVRVSKDGKMEMDPVKVESLDFSGKDLKNDIKGSIIVKGTAELILPDNADEWINRDLHIVGKVYCEEIVVSKATGRIDYHVEPMVRGFELNEVEELLGSTGAELKLDFFGSDLNLDIFTNLGLPVIADVELIPYYDGKADNERAASETVRLVPSASADEESVTEFAFDEDKILALLDEIPEKIDIRIEARTDTEMECVLEPMADYHLKTDYVFDLPLSFDENTQIVYRDTIPDMPEIIGMLLKEGNLLKIAGEIENSIPFEIDLQMNFLDSDGGVIAAADGCGFQHIAPCNPDGSASKTSLALTFALDAASRNSAPDIASLELVFSADSRGAEGIPLKEDAYLSADIMLVLPEGITVDLRDVLKNE